MIELERNQGASNDQKNQPNPTTNHRAIVYNIILPSLRSSSGQIRMMAGSTYRVSPDNGSQGFPGRINMKKYDDGDIAHDYVFIGLIIISVLFFITLYSAALI